MSDMTEYQFANGDGREGLAYRRPRYANVDNFTMWPSKPPIKIVDMTDTHLDNAIRYLSNNKNRTDVADTLLVALKKEKEKRDGNLHTTP